MALIETRIVERYTHNPNYNLGISFEGLSAEEVATLIDCSIKIEQARTGEVLSPTEYGNRFSGLEIQK